MRHVELHHLRPRSAAARRPTTPRPAGRPTPSAPAPTRASRAPPAACGGPARPARPRGEPRAALAAARPRWRDPNAGRLMSKPDVDRPSTALEHASPAFTPRPPRKEAVMKVSHRITRLATAGLIAGALAAPAASARPAPTRRSPSTRSSSSPRRPSCRASTTASTGPPPPSAPAPPAASSCSSASAAPPTATATSTSASRTSRDPLAAARPPPPSFGGRAGEHSSPRPRSPASDHPVPDLKRTRTETRRFAYCDLQGVSIGETGFEPATARPPALPRCCLRIAKASRRSTLALARRPTQTRALVRRGSSSHVRAVVPRGRSGSLRPRA